MGKRILISSIPAWNQKQGSDTWSSLFSFADPDDVANIYIDPVLPDSKVASRYFNINESAVIKSVLKRGIITGHEILNTAALPPKNTSVDMNSYNSILSFLRGKRWRILLWARELAWKFGRWKSPHLNEFLSDFNPDIFAFSIESYAYFNRLNEYIINRTKPRKVVAYLWDDNFTYKQSGNLLDRIERFFLRRQVYRLIGKSTDVIAISPKMKEECDSEFGIESTVITKPIYDTKEFCEYIPGNPLKILYTGKLIIGREKSISEVAKAIKAVNADGVRVIFDIYTNTELTRDIRTSIENSEAVRIHPPVPQSKVFELQKEADILLFAESLSCKNLTARLSFSTKLTDYFAAGKCIWAIGNKDLGPISYLEDEDAGIVSDSIESIQQTLSRLLDNPVLISSYARKSYECGRRLHNAESIVRTLRDSVLQY